jgi:Kdo2-lipid IVA lauroyltransferase/acyltransferase
VGSPQLSFGRRLRRRFYWLMARGLLGLGSCLRISAGRRLGAGLAVFASRLRTGEMACARGNLDLAFPEMSAAGRDDLLRDCTRALGRNLFDMLAARRLLEAPGLVTCEAQTDRTRPSLVETLVDLASQGRGVLILTGHLGCWELLGGWLGREVAAAGLGTLAVVTGTIHNEPVDKMVQDRRRRLGMKALPREAGVRPLLQHLHDGGVAAVLLDQNTRVQNEAVPFFGHDTPTASGPARIILKYGIPVLPVAIARVGVGHEVRHLDPIRTEPGTDGANESNAVVRLLGECNAALEKMIRRNPAEWVWFHRRWNENPSETVSDGDTD